MRGLFYRVSRYTRSGPSPARQCTKDLPREEQHILQRQQQSLLAVPYSKQQLRYSARRPQQALAPLASSWNTSMSEAQKRKWLEISRNYSALSPEDQATLNSRMNDWVSLSPQQRAQARLNFGKTKELSRQLTPEEKKAKWEAYQALSPEEKQKLAAKASPKPTGAATAIKPVAPQKLATLPAQAASKPGTKPAPKIMPPATVAGPATPPTGQASDVGTGTAPLR